MPDYTVEIKPSAEKELDRFDDALFTRVDRKILSLAQSPRPSGCQKMRGFADLWRIRVGVYRIVYSIDDSTRTVTILRVAHRREVYD